MIDYSEIIKDIQAFMLSPERIPFVKQSAKEAKATVDKLIESMRIKAMTKYIVKNCPARKPMITVDGKHGGKTMFDVCSEGKYTPCQDRTDCPIKQVVDKCWVNRYEGGTDTDILEILDVEEVV